MGGWEGSHVKGELSRTVGKTIIGLVIRGQNSDQGGSPALNNADASAAGGFEDIVRGDVMVSVFEHSRVGPLSGC